MRKGLRYMVCSLALLVIGHAAGQDTLYHFTGAPLSTLRGAGAITQADHPPAIAGYFIGTKGAGGRTTVTLLDSMLQRINTVELVLGRTEFVIDATTDGNSYLLVTQKGRKRTRRVLDLKGAQLGTGTHREKGFDPGSIRATADGQVQQLGKAVRPLRTSLPLGRSGYVCVQRMGKQDRDAMLVAFSEQLDTLWSHRETGRRNEAMVLDVLDASDRLVLCSVHRLNSVESRYRGAELLVLDATTGYVMRRLDLALEGAVHIPLRGWIRGDGYLVVGTYFNAGATRTSKTASGAMSMHADRWEETPVISRIGLHDTLFSQALDDLDSTHTLLFFATTSLPNGRILQLAERFETVTDPAALAWNMAQLGLRGQFWADISLWRSMDLVALEWDSLGKPVSVRSVQRPEYTSHKDGPNYFFLGLSATGDPILIQRDKSRQLAVMSDLNAAAPPDRPIAELKKAMNWMMLPPMRGKAALLVCPPYSGDMELRLVPMP